MTYALSARTYSRLWINRKDRFTATSQQKGLTFHFTRDVQISIVCTIQCHMLLRGNLLTATAVPFIL